MKLGKEDDLFLAQPLFEAEDEPPAVGEVDEEAEVRPLPSRWWCLAQFATMAFLQGWYWAIPGE
jgi:hypothetical protein